MKKRRHHEIRKNTSTTVVAPADVYTLATGPHDIYLIWNEFHGLAQFHEIIPGGIAALEAKYQNKWRKHFSHSDRLKISNMKYLVEYITLNTRAMYEYTRDDAEQDRRFSECPDVHATLDQVHAQVCQCKSIQTICLFVKKNELTLRHRHTRAQTLAIRPGPGNLLKANT